MRSMNSLLSFSLSPLDQVLDPYSSQNASGAGNLQSLSFYGSSPSSQQIFQRSLPANSDADASPADHTSLSLFEAFDRNAWQNVPAIFTGESMAEGKSEAREFEAPAFISTGRRGTDMPKLADFLGGGSVLPTASFEVPYPVSHGAGSEINRAYEGDLKMIAGSGLQAVSLDSISEFDSVSATRERTVGGFGGYCTDSSNDPFFPNCGLGASQTRGVVQPTESAVSDSMERSVVTTESDATKIKTIDTFGQRTSIYRGVTKHRWTGRYEAHLWDNSCKREGQARKGRQVYLGGYDKEDKAARAYDLAALKYWGPTATTNFPVSCYTKELEDMKDMTRQEFIAALRRKSSGFSRGASIYRGVTRHHQQGRWQARIGRVAGNKDLYLGTFSTEEEAAEAYDIAAIKFRGANAITNFEMSRYDVNAIMSSTLPFAASGATTAAACSSNVKRPKNSYCSSLNDHATAGLVPHSLLCSPYAATAPAPTADLLGNHCHLFNPCFFPPAATDDASAAAAAASAVTIAHDPPSIPAAELCSRGYYYIANYHQNPIFRQINSLDMSPG